MSVFAGVGILARVEPARNVIDLTQIPVSEARAYGVLDMQAATTLHARVCVRVCVCWMRSIAWRAHRSDNIRGARVARA